MAFPYGILFTVIFAYFNAPVYRIQRCLCHLYLFVQAHLHKAGDSTSEPQPSQPPPTASNKSLPPLVHRRLRPVVWFPNIPFFTFSFLRLILNHNSPRLKVCLFSQFLLVLLSWTTIFSSRLWFILFQVHWASIHLQSICLIHDSLYQLNLTSSAHTELLTQQASFSLNKVRSSSEQSSRFHIL